MQEKVMFVFLIFLFCKTCSGIIGGHFALSNQFPYATAINVQTSNSKFFCGGTLYSNQWIITAGQCVNGAVIFTINLGSINLDQEDSNRMTLATSEYVLHPSFNPSTLNNDIGLIRLRMKIEYTDWIKPISALPTITLPDESYLRAIGWGQTTDYESSLSSNLKYVYVTTLSNQECRLVYGNQISDSMVCIEGNYNEGICHGDTGSPLLEIFGLSEAVHVGVASFVSGNGCESTDPSGYTRTQPYVTWIKNTTAL